MVRIVLCVDDDPDDREVIQSAIYEVDPSLTVVHAENGKVALEWLNNSKNPDLPCLIIIDINMPVMDGKQTVREIKMNNKLSKIPVVVFTTSSHPSDQHFCKQYGVEMITKPINFRQITFETERILQHCSN